VDGRMDEQMDYSLVVGSGSTRSYSRVIIMVYHSCLFLTNNPPPFLQLYIGTF